MHYSRHPGRISRRPNPSESVPNLFATGGWPDAASSRVVTLCYFLFHQCLCILSTDIARPVSLRRSLELLVTITITTDELAIYRERFTTTYSRPGRLDYGTFTPFTRRCRYNCAYRGSANPDQRDVQKQQRILQQSRTRLETRRRMRTSLYILSKADGAKRNKPRHRLQEVATKGV
jgi:hypothetical protein